jgi:hypothetical protein
MLTFRPVLEEVLHFQSLPNAGQPIFSVQPPLKTGLFFYLLLMERLSHNCQTGIAGTIFAASD